MAYSGRFLWAGLLKEDIMLSGLKGRILIHAA